MCVWLRERERENVHMYTASLTYIHANITLPSHCPTVSTVWWEVGGRSWAGVRQGSHRTRASLSLSERHLDMGSSKGLVRPRGWEEVNTGPSLRLC